MSPPKLPPRPPPTPAPSSGECHIPNCHDCGADIAAGLAPARSIIVTDRVFILAAITALLVAVCLACLMGFLAFFAMRSESTVRDLMRSEQLRANTCDRESLLMQGRLEQMNTLVKLSSDHGGKCAMGGN